MYNKTSNSSAIVAVKEKQTLGSVNAKDQHKLNYDVRTVGKHKHTVI